jgi:ribosomal protein L7Ae-like RNA K-turn-binding protein
MSQEKSPIKQKQKHRKSSRVTSQSKDSTSTNISRNAKKSANIQVKNVFSSPFHIKWPTVSDVDRDAIIQSISTTIPKRRRQRRRNKQTQTQTLPLTSSKAATMTSPIATINVESNAVRYGDELALGLNEVTRALEKGIARLVVVCRDVQPPVLVQHLPILAQQRDVPICLLPTSPYTLAHLFGLRTLIAFAFKNVANSKYDELMKFISARTPTVEVEWLRARHNVTLFPLKVHHHHRRRRHHHPTASKAASVRHDSMPKSRTTQATTTAAPCASLPQQPADKNAQSTVVANEEELLSRSRRNDNAQD